nr:uncharacterized protein LOC129266711 [Lytechinus pictus]
MSGPSQPVGSSNMPNRVILWTTYRCVSTAFTRSMGQIPGIEIWPEPFGYANIAKINYELNEGIDLPTSYEGNEAAFDKAAHYIGKLVARKIPPEALSYESIRMVLETSTAENVFVKDIGLAMQSRDLREFIPEGYRHSFLIRHPLLVYSSLHKANYNQLRNVNLLHADETNEDEFDLRRHKELLGDPTQFFSSLHDVWLYIKENIDPAPPIIDASELLENPDVMMPKYCKAVGLPYTTQMLKWEPSLDVIQSWKWPFEISQDTSYLTNVISSTGFSKPQDLPSLDTVTSDVVQLAKEALPFYEKMYNNRLL